MEPVIVAAIIGVLGGVMVALVASHAGRKRRHEPDGGLESAIHDLVLLLREPLTDPEDDPTAWSLFTRLKEKHSVNYVVAAFYILREREIIRWEGVLLHPDDQISLVVR